MSMRAKSDGSMPPYKTESERLMGLRHYKPTTAGRRGASVSDFAELTPAAKPEKRLLRPKTQDGRPQQPGHDHRRGIAAAATSSSTE